MSQPSIVGRDFWRRHVDDVLRVVARALDLLDAEQAAEAEDDLNRRFYFCLLKANAEVKAAGMGGFDAPPLIEACNQPSPDDPYRTAREWKRPDFTWAVIDHQAADPCRGVRAFIIECKRLGAPPRPTWPLNENYIRNGVRRFLTLEHRYACDETSGAMIGYVQDMQPVDILAEVNVTAAAESIVTLPAPAGGWNVAGTSELRHMLERAHGKSPFELLHFWVDLRTRIRPPAVAPAGPGAGRRGAGKARGGAGRDPKTGAACGAGGMVVAGPPPTSGAAQAPDFPAAPVPSGRQRAKPRRSSAPQSASSAAPNTMGEDVQPGA